VLSLSSLLDGKLGYEQQQHLLKGAEVLRESANVELSTLATEMAAHAKRADDHPDVAALALEWHDAEEADAATGRRGSDDVTARLRELQMLKRTCSLLCVLLCVYVSARARCCCACLRMLPSGSSS